MCDQLTDLTCYSLAALLAIAGLLVLLFDRRQCRCGLALLLTLAAAGTSAAQEPTFDVFGITDHCIEQPAPIVQVSPPRQAFDLFGVQTPHRTEQMRVSQKVAEPHFPIGLTLYIVEGCPHCPRALAAIHRLKNVEVTVMIDRHPKQVRSFPCWCWANPKGGANIKTTTDVAEVARLVARTQGFEVSQILRE